MDSQGNIWTQTDGTAIERSISGDIAAIYMEFYENEFVLDPKKYQYFGFDKLMMCIVCGNMDMRTFHSFLHT